MRKPEKKKKQTKEASTTKKLYPKKGKKSSPKSSDTRRRASQKAAETRKLRREKAQKAVPIDELLPLLDLQQEGTPICPFCQSHNSLSLDTEQGEFDCQACRTKGNLIKLVKKALDLTDWQAVAYLENLASVEKNNENEPKDCCSAAKEEQIPEEIPEEEIESFTWLAPVYREEFHERVERIKDAHCIEELIVSMTQAQFKRVGENLFCCCPFDDHLDKTPSFAVHPGKQLFHCFGCSRGGDVLAFIMLYRECKFHEALSFLDKCGDPATDSSSFSHVNPTQLVERCRDFFHKCILSSQPAQEFLRERGLFNAQLVGFSRLGFDDGTINQAIREDVVKDLQELGMLNEKGNSRFYRCLTVGLEDAEGNVVSLYGRRIQPQNASKHQFPKGNCQGIFNVSMFKASNEVILTEGVLDALAVWVIGWHNVSCIFSASHVPTLLVDQLTRYSITRVYLALDNDAPGEKACRMVAERLRGLDIEVLRVCLPEGIKDANELLMRSGDQAKEIFKEALERAQLISPSVLPQTSESSCKATTENRLTLSWSERKGRVEGGVLDYTIELVAREHGALRVVITAEHAGKFHTDKLDLFRSQARTSFSYTAGKRFQVPAERVEQDLEEILVAMRKINLRKSGSQVEAKQVVTSYSRQELQIALAWLKKDGFFEDIPGDYEALGYVGEAGSKQIVYLCAVSRKMCRPLPCIILASSAGGKTELMNTTARLTPDEDALYLSEISKQALYYMNSSRIRHKLIIVDERKGSEEANYAIRTLLSRGVLKKAVPVKDANGEMQTMIRELVGPIGYMESTTDEYIHPENENRCLCVHLDDSQEQTRRIHQAQREYFTREGREKRRVAREVIRRHQAAQSLLKECKVDIPFVHHLSFPSHWCRTRRDNQKFLQLLATITFLHQYQRKQYQEGNFRIVVAQLADYQIAYRLSPLLLRPAVSDLSDKHYELLSGIDDYIEEQAHKSVISKQDVIFTRSEISRHIGWQLHQIKSYLPRLVEMEYIVLIGSGVKGSTFRHRRNYSVPDPSNPLSWLITPEHLAKKVDAERG